MMMICRWITLTSQHLWQNHHIKQYLCQIRAWKKSVVSPVFQICLLYTSHTRDRQFEPIKLHYSKNVWSTRLSKFVIVCAFRSKNCGSPGFQTILKTGQTTLFFSCPYLTEMLLYMVILSMMLWRQTESTGIPSSRFLYTMFWI